MKTPWSNDWITPSPNATTPATSPSHDTSKCQIVCPNQRPLPALRPRPLGGAARWKRFAASQPFSLTTRIFTVTTTPSPESEPVSPSQRLKRLPDQNHPDMTSSRDFLLRTTCSTFTTLPSYRLPLGRNLRSDRRLLPISSLSADILGSMASQSLFFLYLRFYLLSPHLTPIASSAFCF